MVTHVSRQFIGLLALVSVTTVELSAQDRTVLTLHRITGAVTLDGPSRESAWDSIPPVPVVMYQPTFNGAMTERTEIRVGYDDDFLYLSGRFFDSDPNGVIASSLERDGGSGADDYFNIGVDAFNDNENVLWFYTTPAGMRGDAALANDAEGNDAYNGSWDTFWDVATERNEQGWFAEVRIPFSSLGFQADGGEVEMGLALSRLIARKNERHVFPAIPPNWGLGFIKPSQAQDVALTGVSARRQLYVTPYAALGTQRLQRTVPSIGDSPYDDEFNRDLGLDLKYSVTSNLTLDATINTDFAQIEADNQQVNLTRFSLFFPEKRQFFQSRSGTFDFTLGMPQERVFHSRQIGLDQGRPVRILGGARVVGRIGRADVGLISMQTDHSPGLPSENFGILRLRERVFNAHSYLGGIATSRLGDDGSYNVVYGLDGIFRVVGDEYLTVKWAQSFEDDVLDVESFDFVESGVGYIEWHRRRNEGINYRFWLTRAGSDFVPGTGFFSRRAFWQPMVSLGYDWFPGASSRFRKLRHDAWTALYFRNEDGVVDEGFWGHSNTFEWKSGAKFYVELKGNRDNLSMPLSLPDGATVPVGGYTFYQGTVELTSPSGQRMRSTLSASGGSFYDGRRYDIAATPSWNPNSHLEIALTYQLNLVRFPVRDESFDAHIGRIRAVIALDTKFSASAFVQYSNVADLVSANVRFRYNFREKNDLWIVYDEGLNLDRGRFDPMLPTTQNRTILAKYTYTFAL